MGEGRGVDQPVNQQLHIYAQLQGFGAFQDEVTPTGRGSDGPVIDDQTSQG